jgi:hypothetical protein
MARAARARTPDVTITRLRVTHAADAAHMAAPGRCAATAHTS